MKTKSDGKFPEAVKRGAVCVKIYRVSGRSGDFYQIADYSEGSRRLRSFSDLGKARAEASRVAGLMAVGEHSAASFRNRDAASFGRALEILRPTGDAIELAASRYAEACKVLGGGERLAVAVRFYAENDPLNLPDKSVAEAVAEFIAHRRSRGSSERYVEDLESRLGRFSDSFKVGIASVKGADVQAWLDKLKSSAQTVKNYRTVIGTLFTFAKARGYVRTNPVQSTEAVTVKSEDSVEIYTPEQIAKLLNAASPDFLPCIAIGAFAGLRSSEIERLTWEDVDLPGGFLRASPRKGRSRSKRLVPVVEALKLWLAPYARRKGLVWSGSHDAFHDGQQATADKAEVTWRSNGLRHSFGSYRLADTQNAGQVSLEMGNSPGMVFKHYRELVKPAEAAKWFAVFPKSEFNVVSITSRV